MVRLTRLSPTSASSSDMRVSRQEGWATAMVPTMLREERREVRVYRITTETSARLRPDALERHCMRRIEDGLPRQIGCRNAKARDDRQEKVDVRSTLESSELASLEAEVLSPEDGERHGIVRVARDRHFGEIGNDGVVEKRISENILRALEGAHKIRHASVVPNLDVDQELHEGRAICRDRFEHLRVAHVVADRVVVVDPLRVARIETLESDFVRSG